MTKRLDAIVAAAVAQGLLLNLEASESANRPWPVVLFTGLISWLIALPLLVLIALIFKPSSSGGIVILGTTVLCISVVTLRIRKIPLFVEQFAVAGLLAGGVGLLLGMSEYGNWTSTATDTCLVALLAALFVPQNWLRSVLGAVAVVLIVMSWTGESYNSMSTVSPWLAWLIISLAYLLGRSAISSLEKEPEGLGCVIALEAVMTGVGITALCGLAYDASPPFDESSWHFLSSLRRSYPLAQPNGSTSVSLLCAATSAGWIAYRWPALRNRWFVPVAIVGMSLAWCIPFMGITQVMLVACLTSGHRQMALLAFINIIWMTGHFYYDLEWPLAHKSMLLFGCAATLAVVTRFGFIEKEPLIPVPMSEPKRAPTGTRWFVVGTAVLALMTVNMAIWQKEKLIAEGMTVYAELAPIDPRSIMQGDYMSLSFRMPEDLSHATSSRTFAVAHRNANGVITLLRKHDGNKLALGEMLIELVRKDRWYVIASDAWFFAEGTGERFTKAKYGEFRIAPDGQALLVGLRGPALEKL